MRKVIVALAICCLGAAFSQAQTHMWTTGPYRGGSVANAGGSTVAWDGQSNTGGEFLPYQSSSFEPQNVWYAEGSLYGPGPDGLILEGISMTYGPLTALATPLPDGSDTYQVFTLSGDANGDNGPVHWSGSFTQYYHKTYHSGAGGTGGGRCHCQSFYTYPPTQGSGSITATQ